MGKRDYRHREPKKAKKEARKPSSPVLPTPMSVEVVGKKGKREKGKEE